MTQRVSQQLMDAYMSGDTDTVERLKAQVATPRPSVSVTVNVNSILNNEHSPTLAIYDILNKYLGDEWWDWEIETIHRVLWVKYTVALGDINSDRMCAIRHLCRNDGAFSDWYEFNQMALSFGRAIADFESLREPSPGMAIAAVKIMNYIRPDRDGEFGADVKKYICIILYNNGIFTPPPSIVFLIKDEMKKLVSNDMIAQWVQILKRYNELESNSNIEENKIDIQAKRILMAEEAASNYCGE